MFDMGKRICKLRRDAHLSQKQLGVSASGGGRHAFAFTHDFLSLAQVL